MWGLKILGYHEVIILGMKAEYKSMALCSEGSVMGELFVNEIWGAYIWEGSFSGGVGGRRGLLSELYGMIPTFCGHLNVWGIQLMKSIVDDK